MRNISEKLVKMTKHSLLESAKVFNQISLNASNEYYSKIDLVVSQVNIKMVNYPNIKQLIGGDNIDLMTDNHNNHVKFIYSILRKLNHEVLVDTIIWVFEVYMNRGFKPDYWTLELNCFIDVLSENLSSESNKEILPLYKWMLSNVASFAELSKLRN